MERCPSELWTHIFGHACTDGGVTGCNIALVSHYFRQAVLRVQLHSVALYEADKLASFADLLERREPAHRRVRHLFISCIDLGPPKKADNHPTHDINDDLTRTLITVAPDLLTLTLLQRASVLCASFPKLTELTLHGPIFYNDITKTSSPHDMFPSLRYLHLLSSCNSLPLYTSRAPALTHLRLSTVGSIGPLLQRALESFLTGSAKTSLDSGAGDGEYSFPPTVQKVLIQMESLIGPNVRIRLREELRALMLADKDNKLKILTKGRTEPRRDTRADWEDRIMGGNGCWGEEDAILRHVDWNV